LILIGPSGTGKTSFAKSLSGQYSYFNGRWRIDDWNDGARYSIFDNIGWDQFEEQGYPNKKRILTQDGHFNVSDTHFSFSH
jgi:ABC-type multidrug transport system ATPase subunit